MNMIPPIQYNALHHRTFAGLDPMACDFERARIAVLSLPIEQPFSSASGSAAAPSAIILASAYMDLWDEELSVDVHDVGIYSLEPFKFPRPDVELLLDEITRVTEALLAAGKFVVALGGDGSVSPPVVRAFTSRHPRLSVLALGAKANLRASVLGSHVHDGCSARRMAELAPCVQVGVRSLSHEEAEVSRTLNTSIVFDHQIYHDPQWIERVLERLDNHVYITLDCSVFNPSVMPAGAQPQPGGLAWRETLALLRAVFERRTVVGCDIVGHSPLPGVVAPTFMCAKLAYKMMTYAFPA